LPVEAGFTRFIALFHTVDSDYVGPIRSIRPTDSTLVVPIGATLQISGGQKYVRDGIRSDGAYVLLDSGGSPRATFRIPERNAPHNLFGNTTTMRQKAETARYPDEAPAPIASFGEANGVSEPARLVSLDFSSRKPVIWRWNGAQYLRFNGDEAHLWFDEEGNTGPIVFDTLLVLKARGYTAKPPANQSGSPVPAFRTVGSGEAYAFYNGEMVEGRWQRDRLSDPFTLTLPDGTEMVLPPGRLWISIFPNDRALTWE